MILVRGIYVCKLENTRYPGITCVPHIHLFHVMCYHVFMMCIV
jgi:hypothetical protein